MAHVIHVGTNEAVLTTRKVILEKAGHHVALARNLREVIAACETRKFDVGIVGQALPPMEKLRVSHTLRERCPDIKLLEFHNALRPDVEFADAHLRVAETSPEDLITTIDQLASGQKNKLSE